MNLKFRLFFLLFIILGLTAVPASAINKVVASYTNLPIRLDGKLDEPAWKHAGIIADLVQQSPHPGEPTPFHTKVYVITTNRALYIGIQCTDPNPSRISVHTMQRDSEMEGDDKVAVLLDTFGDNRTGFLFQVNPAGARTDGLISGPESMSLDWDGIWNARTRRTKTGWTVEMRIPAHTLRFTPGQEVWKMDVQRWVARKQLSLRWAGTTLDCHRFDMRHTGALAGMKRMNQGHGFSVSPYGVVNTNQNFQDGHSALKATAGLDLRYSITPGISGMLTLNTDFAETEVDTRQVNLTRFSLFFPEKREFFLEGSNLFNFGTGLHEDFIPFYSRRIGLYDGKQIPIDFGVKVMGQQGPWSMAMLDVQTRDSDSVPATNMFAGRLTYDVNSHLRIGTIMTNGNPDGISDNTMAGVDALWTTSTFRGNKNFSIGGWFAGTSGDLEAGRKSGWGFKVDYPNDLWDMSITYKEFGDAMDPGLGFLPRPGTRQLSLGMAYQPRPGGRLGNWVRQMFFESYFRYVESLKGVTESWRLFTAPFNVDTQSGAHFEFNIAPQYEFLYEPFEISDGVFIPAGGYHFLRFRVELESPRSNPFVIGTSTWFGEFYTGRLTQARAYLHWSGTGGHLHMELQTEHDYGYLPQGNFVERLWQFKLVYAFTPDLVLSSYTQYDNSSREIGVNNRLRWTIAPGRDIFLVWNYGWEQPLYRPLSRSIPLSNQIALKCRWTWRW
ncbi:MAG: carbohydrate binding family 9 domain-containing protein [Acidobacteria bacterium]|nr:carbohydrate binding family 9 domain-containing protein [Acidobacteriota bacterium]